jgi:hypothetical protein
MDLSASSLVKSIKSKKEFLGLPDSLVEENLLKVLKKHNISIESLNEKESNIIKKEVRKILRNLTGQYQISRKNRTKLLENKNIEQLLQTHSSTKERLNFYSELKELIKKLKIKSILDLGCGLNPLALADKKITYYASDIREDEISIISDYFHANKLKGKAYVQNLMQENLEFPKTDLCLIFKVLDVIDSWPYPLTRKILSSLDSKNILVSFATKKLSGKRMNLPQRSWFEKILFQMNLNYEKFSSDNEVFYLIKKLS